MPLFSVSFLLSDRVCCRRAAPVLSLSEEDVDAKGDSSVNSAESYRKKSQARQLEGGRNKSRLNAEGDADRHTLFENRKRGA